MPTKYTTGYGLVPNSPTPTYLYRGPHVERAGQNILRFHTFNGTLAFNANAALNDVLFIAGGFMAGERVRRITNTRTPDPDAANDFLFNLGWRLGSATAFAAASNAMQGTVAFEVTEAAAIAIGGALKGDDLILTPTAGAAEVTALHTFLVETYLPTA